ncbi:uncharacterized protein LOC132958164 isoform X12 [Labrus mixtus]|uniref:uncharacterized protein LOC132958164 isoform X11 n=1 Tax=Labrus mixtus TaxID=508554 RepID=UPI0029C008C4|nr:uncharacterized protein LOC132958164 isoform X11 [Labrus mixtus]XP_060886795.1 uncharacterized protein LOC132958164 isoform X12 [Labrus mixtus]
MSYHGLTAHQRSKGPMPRGLNSKMSQQKDMLGNYESDDNEGDLWLEVKITEAETAADYSDKSQQAKKGCTPRGKRYEGSQQQDMLGKSGLKTNQKDFNRSVHNLTTGGFSADYSDKSQQVCDCGWTKWTTDRGLRIHQAKKGCTPRGKRYEGSQQKDMLGNDESDDNEGDLWLEVNNTEAETAADYSDKSQQGKKGCTPRGKRYEGSQQKDMLGNDESDDNEGDLWLEVNNTEAETAADYSDKSQQVCDCGWNKWTTDRGLRIHQAKKGCTPSGKRYEGSAQRDINFNRGVHNLTTGGFSADYSDKSQQICDCGWTKWTTDRGLKIHQGRKGCTPKGLRIPQSDQHFWKTWWCWGCIKSTLVIFFNNYF